MPADDPRPQRREPDIFDDRAGEYDAWHNTPPGSLIFASELDAVRPLLEGAEHPSLEVGVGTGRFAAALGISDGIDPARHALEIAVSRGVNAAHGRAESLPYPDRQFGAVVFIVALCFVDDPKMALKEARRVLQADGVLILGILPADGPWARHYQALAAHGNPYFNRSRFFSRDEIFCLLREEGFKIERIRSALFWSPDQDARIESAREGDNPEAGFLAILAIPSP